ncbi:MAG: DUF58 domain-containing protein [Balneolales bacterium]
MISQELFKKIRKLEIRTKGLVNNVFSGEYQTAFKGRGMVFSEVRPYQYGDDIRQIDWNVTARYDEPYIKIFEEEREQTLMLCVDISRSGFFGSHNQSKMDLAIELSALLAFSAIKNNDKVGMVMFSDQIEKVIPPRKGRLHVLRLMRELFTTKPKGTGTDIAKALQYVNGILNRKSILVLASDFQSVDYQKQIKVTNKKHDLVTIIIDDPLENDLPDLGVIPFRDAESGNVSIVDTSSKQVRTAYKARRLQNRAELNKLFLKMHVDTITVHTNMPYIKPVMQFFERRVR